MRTAILALICSFMWIGCSRPPSRSAAPIVTPTTPVVAEEVEPEPPFATVDAATFRGLIKEQGSLVLDVRTPGEFARGRLADATAIDAHDPRFAQRLALLPHDKPVFVYCATGSRSDAAAQVLVEKGFAHVSTLNGGIMAWTAAGLPVDRTAVPVAQPGENAMKPDAMDALLKAEKRVLVDYSTTWCGPCRKMLRVLEGLNDTWKGQATVMQVDVDQSDLLAAREKITVLPTFVLYVDGQERWRKSGEFAREVLDAELARP